MKTQYWIKLKYKDGLVRWELTAGKYNDDRSVRKAYEARGKALHFDIMEVKPHEQFEFKYD